MHFAKFAIGPLVPLQILVTDTNRNKKQILMLLLVCNILIYILHRYLNSFSYENTVLQFKYKEKHQLIGDFGHSY